MSNKQVACGRLDKHSLLEFAKLIRQRGLLDKFVKRVPPFSKMSLGWYMHLPVILDRPAREIYPGAGPVGFRLKLGFKANEFCRFAKREGVHDIFADFFSTKYFHKLQRRYECALSLEADRILRHLQGRLAQQLSPDNYQNVIDDLCRHISADNGWPPRQIILDALNEIAIRLLGNGAPHRLWQHVVNWNMDRGDDTKSGEFLERLGRVRSRRPKEMFDEKDWAIMLLWDEMPRGIPPLARWRDEAALGCVKLVCRDHVFSMDAYRDRLRKLGLSPERPKLVKGSLKGRTLAIEWASPVRNLVKSRTGKN